MSIATLLMLIINGRIKCSFCCFLTNEILCSSFIENSAKDHRVVRVTSVCKKVVSAFSFSSFKLKQSWNSHKKWEQESAISQVLKTDKKTRQLAPSWQDIEVMECVKKALGPLRDFTDALSGEDYVSLICQASPAPAESQPPWAEWRRHWAHQHNEDNNPQLPHWKVSVITDDLLDMASLLDPRFKRQYIDSDKTEEIQARAVSEIEFLLSTAQHSLPTSTSQSDPGAECQPPPKKAQKKTLGSLLKISGAASAAGTTASTTSIREAIEGEMKAYLSTPHADSEMDPLEWWKVHEGNFPRVSQLAQKYLCIPATSAPSERVFRSGGNIVTCQRATLKPEKVDK